MNDVERVEQRLLDQIEENAEYDIVLVRGLAEPAVLAEHPKYPDDGSRVCLTCILGAMLGVNEEDLASNGGTYEGGYFRKEAADRLRIDLHKAGAIEAGFEGRSSVRAPDMYVQDDPATGRPYNEGDQSLQWDLDFYNMGVRMCAKSQDSDDFELTEFYSSD